VHADSKKDFPFDPGQPGQRNSDNYTLDEEIREFAREIADTLRNLCKLSPAPRVFLADTSPGRAPQADDIKNWLVQQGALVLRASGTGLGWEEESRTLIAKADLFVDLHEATPSPVAEIQAQLANELKKPRVRWLPRGELPPEAVQQLLNETKVIEESLETFKEALLRSHLTRPSGFHKPASPDASATGNGAAGENSSNALLLLVAASRDVQRVDELQSKIDEIGCGRDAFVRDDKIEKPDMWRKELQEMLEMHDPAGVVFIDGDCDGSWADTRLRDLVALMRDSVPQAKRALCTFPPPNKPRRYRPPVSLVVRLDPAQLDKLKELL
jgi:hypothetical protein